jgi:putative ABC transport system ATP-binding protein
VALIEVENLYKTYQLGTIAVPALRGVTLAIEAGDFVVLAGPSGSGKTTLLNLLGALDLPDRGVVRIHGEDFLGLSKDARAAYRLRHIGFVFQAYNLIRVLSARENVAYVLQLQGMKKPQRLARAEQLLADVGLAGYGDRRPEQLSGGQQQRVAVARALATRPAIVLADEPTASLDSATGEALVALMEKLNREQGITFVLASHDAMVMAHARRLIRMHDGSIVHDGKVW